MPTKLGTYVVRPDHMSEFAKIAESRGLSVSAQLRVLVAEFLKRERRAARVDGETSLVKRTK